MSSDSKAFSGDCSMAEETFSFKLIFSGSYQLVGYCLWSEIHQADPTSER